MTRITSANQNPRHYEVLVIGAGMSGLTCASRLYRHDYFKNPGRLLLLEGRDRIGGRIASVNVNGIRLDTGANWIHGVGTAEDPNPLMKLVEKKRYRALSGTVSFKAPAEDSSEVESASRTIKSTGEPQVIPKDVAGIISSGLWGTIGDLHETAAKITPEEARRTTIFKAVIEAESFKETFDNLPKEYHLTFGAMFQFIENMEAGPLIEQSLERPEGKPCMSLLEYAIADFSGEQVFVQDGYTDVVEDIADELIQGGLVKLNAEVTHIDWTSKPIQIHAGHGRYTADTVVCTLPLGVLKDERSRLFKPALPLDKDQAIQKLGYGTLDKVFLVFDHAWWNQDPYLSILKKGLVKAPIGASDLETPDILVGFTEDLPGFEVHQDGTTSSAACDISVINLHNLSGFPVLLCYVACSRAIKIEQMSNDKAGKIISDALSNWFGQDIPDASAVHVTRWAKDQFSKGSYSHMIAGLSETADRVKFQDPIVNHEGGVLRFAGEHTSRNHFATVHGAFISGRREADAILNQMKLTSEP